MKCNNAINNLKLSCVNLTCIYLNILHDKQIFISFNK